MKLKNILRPSLMMTLAVMSQLLLMSSTGARAIMKPLPEPPGPDLMVVSAIYKDPKVIVRIKNAGNVGAPPSVLAVLLLKRFEAGSTKPEALTFKLPVLFPGQIIDRTYEIGNSPFTDNGALAVSLDYENEINESDERNNYKKVSLPPLPDLVIQSVELVDNKATVTILNKCEGTAGTSSIRIEIYGLGKNPAVQLGWDVGIPPIDGKGVFKKIIFVPGSSDESSPQTFKGRKVRFVVDAHNKLKEAVETNNWWETGAAPFPDPANSCNPAK
jgi:hypothetical protein